MAAINRMGLGLGRFNLASDHGSLTSTLETISEGIVLTTFSRFAELPFELRLKIWGYVCFHPRNVDIFTESLGMIRVGEPLHFNAYKYYSHFCPHPAILHVCQESREEALKHYQLEFGTSNHFPIITISTPPRIYVNFDCDRLCLLAPDLFGTELERPFQGFVQICKKHGARSLAINVVRDEHWPLVDVATSWNALEELVLFDWTRPFDQLGSTGVSIDFVKPYGVDLYNGDEYLKGAAMRQLEIARRDFLALFEMHKDGLQFDRSHKVGSTSARARETLSWKPPVVEIRHLVVSGKREINDWAIGDEGY